MLSIIPLPKECKELDGFYTLSDNQAVKSDFDLPLVDKFLTHSDDADFVVIRDDDIAKEGYRLVVKPQGITISASTQIGVYYALQTIRKISKSDLGNKQVPCCEIADEPRFGWRGIEIDVSRHFYTVEQIKKFLDMMFMEKLNVFHWHLTDDNGWRIEIKKYPRLTEIGSVRKYTQIGGWRSIKLENKEYSGFYTQEQIKDIVAYAKARGIMVVPEIDFPAHSAAAIASYNHLACREIESDVFGFFGGKVPVVLHHNKSWNRTLCCGKDTTFEFIFGVLDEVCELFDAPYIHLGGDEAPTDEWMKCPNCQRVMKENNLKNGEQLQGWFENKLNAYLKTKGKKFIGWNEVLSASNIETDDKNIVVQYWTPKRDKNAEKYVNSGGQMIMSNHQAFYFDMPYALYPLSNTYNYKPENFGVNKDNVSNVLGVEGELWTEWIRDYDRLQMMAFPRMQALSEVAWSPAQKRDFDDFKKRLDDYKPTLEALGINYAVDKISLPKNKLYRSRVHRKFLKGNPDLENQLNAKYKAKGEK